MTNYVGIAFSAGFSLEVRTAINLWAYYYLHSCVFWEQNFFIEHEWYKVFTSRYHNTQLLHLHNITELSFVDNKPYYLIRVIKASRSAESLLSRKTDRR